MTNDDPSRVKTFKRRTKKLPMDTNASSSSMQEESRHGHVFIKQEERDPPSFQRETTEELLSLLMKTDGVLSVETDDDAMMVAKDDNEIQKSSSSSSSQKLVSLSENQEKEQQQQQQPKTSSTNNNNNKNDSILFFLFIVTIISLFYSIYTNQHSLISKGLSHFYTLMENLSFEWLWIIKDKMKEMKWNMDIAIHSLTHFMDEYYYIIQQHMNQVLDHIAIQILDLRHGFAEWIDPYPRCTNHY
ncbi:hypothetical protein BDC45DRAFT_493452 [Circinella umbellata]|nr:hypothetical protein BDC45DRAFT_493452 [Circinella umbellata]